MNELKVKTLINFIDLCFLILNVLIQLIFDLIVKAKISNLQLYHFILEYPEGFVDNFCNLQLLNLHKKFKSRFI